MSTATTEDIRMKIHPLAASVPEMQPEEFEELKASIAANGQREMGIVLDGLILDGRHRERACDELGIPFDFRPYDNKRDGLIPELLVMDNNIRRRHLSGSQKAAIAAELTDKIEAAKAKLKKEGDAGTKTESTAEAAAAVGADETNTRKAGKLKDEDPGEFGKVKGGEKSLGQAKKDAAKKKARENKYRQETADALKDHHDEEFITAIRDGVILPKEGDLKDFLALELTKQKAIKSMIVKGWKTSKAVAYLDDDITAETTVNDLINKAMDTESKDHFSDQFAGWEITITKIDSE